MKKENVFTKELIRNSNRKKILNLIKEKKVITKQEISKILDISIPTVTTNVNMLIEDGYIKIAGVADSTGGRKPEIIEFIPNAKYSFGVDISPNRVRIILTDLNSKVLEDFSFKISELKDINNIVIKVKNIIEGIIDSRELSNDRLLGIGFSLPGIVNEKKLILEAAPNLGIKKLNLTDFETIFNIPVYVENEANSGAYAESILGKANHTRNIIYISITEGIGTGIIIQDHMYKGRNKRAGEFGHMRISNNGKKCNCGREDCWELYASENALLHLYNESSSNRIDDIDYIFKLYELGDKETTKIIDIYLTNLAIGIQNIILNLDPHYIVIGGSISYYEDILLDKLKEKVFQQNVFFGCNDNKLVFSALRGDASILGASLLPFQGVFYMDDKRI